MEATVKIKIGELNDIVKGVRNNGGKLKLYRKIGANISKLEGVIDVHEVSFISGTIDGVSHSRISPVVVTEDQVRHVRSDVEIIRTSSGLVIGRVSPDGDKSFLITREIDFDITIED